MQFQRNTEATEQTELDLDDLPYNPETDEEEDMEYEEAIMEVEEEED
jgi:hypothetical protein